jgi:hypothetical protein
MTRLVYCPGVCRECGCSDEAPCDGGCSWVEDDLCSACSGGLLEEGDVLEGDPELFE